MITKNHLSEIESLLDSRETLRIIEEPLEIIANEVEKLQTELEISESKRQALQKKVDVYGKFIVRHQDLIERIISSVEAIEKAGTFTDWSLQETVTMEDD